MDRRESRFQNAFLRERDDKGSFLYEELKKHYQQTGDSRSLINFIKDTDIFLPRKENGELAILAVQNHDWKLLHHLGFITGKPFL